MSLVIREIQIKSTVRCLHTHQMATEGNTQEPDNPGILENRLTVYKGKHTHTYHRATGRQDEGILGGDGSVV